MPIDGSGNFTRVHNWVADKAGGVKVVASRMDAEFDNYANALNQAFWRSGIVGMTGTLNMGANGISGIESGSVGVPAIRFSSDATTGLYSPASGKVALTAGGTNRLEANATGVAVTGAVTLSSTLAVTGAVTLSSTLGVTGVATVGSLSTAGTISSGNATVTGLTVNGSAAVTGTLGVTGVATVGSLSTAGTISSGNATVTGLTVNGSASTTGNVTVGGTLLLANAGFMFSSDGGQDTGFRWVSDGVMVARSNGVDLLTYKPSQVGVSGSLGVGTTNPSRPLDVVANDNWIRQQNPSRSWLMGLSTGSNWRLYDETGGVDRLTVQTDGRVVIGAAASTQMLNVPGAAYATSGFYANAGSGIWFNGGASNNAGVSSDGSNVVLTAGGTARLTVGSSGDIASTDLPNAVGFKGAPQLTANTSFSLAANQVGRHVYITGGATDITVPTNATTALAVGFVVTLINDGSAAKTIQQSAGVTLKLAGTGTTGSKTLAVGGMATLVKVAADTWFVSGAGVS